MSVLHLYFVLGLLFYFHYLNIEVPCLTLDQLKFILNTCSMLLMIEVKNSYPAIPRTSVLRYILHLGNFRNHCLSYLNVKR